MLNPLTISNQFRLFSTCLQSFETDLNLQRIILTSLFQLNIAYHIEDK